MTMIVGLFVGFALGVGATFVAIIVIGDMGRQKDKDRALK